MSQSLPGFARLTDAGLQVSLNVRPRAKRTAVRGVHADRLKVDVAAAPSDGRANLELCRHFAGLAGVPRSAVAVVAGGGSRLKLLEIVGAHAVEALKPVFDRAVSGAAE